MYNVRFMIIAGFLLTQTTLDAQEFPIAAGRDTAFSMSAVFGGTNGLVAIIGDTLSQYNITAQLIYPPDSLIGNRISVGRTGTFPGGPVVVFDGTNYLMGWKEDSGDVKGQFISTSGNVVGTYFTIGTNASLDEPYAGGLAFNDTAYLAVYVKADTQLYGQRVSKSGNLIGGQIEISSNSAWEAALAYDGTNYLVAWVDHIDGQDHDFYGQFVSKAGTLVGSNFLIDGNPNTTENGLALAFDGTRYLLVYPDENPNTGAKNLLARFITTAGTIEETIVVCDSTKNPNMPGIAFDNDNYLITWTQFYPFFNESLMGRFYNPSGVPIDAPFMLFNTLNNKIPIGGCGFGGGKYLVVASRLNYSGTDGDVYGRFIQPLTGVEDKNKLIPEKFVLFQNYPNPFNPSTVIRYSLPATRHVMLRVFNVLGQEVAALVNEEMKAGTHEATWDATGFASGVYFYRLRAGDFTQTKKLILLQ